jgi:hypothetical protein
MRHFLVGPKGTGRLGDHLFSTIRPGRPIDVARNLLGAEALGRRTPSSGPRGLGDRPMCAPYSSMKMHSPGHSSEASVTKSSSPEGT